MPLIRIAPAALGAVAANSLLALGSVGGSAVELFISPSGGGVPMANPRVDPKDVKPR